MLFRTICLYYLCVPHHCVRWCCLILVEYQWTETAVTTHPNLYIESFKGRRYGQSYNTTNVLLLLYRIWCCVFYLQNTLYFENKNLHGDFSQEGILREGCLTGKFSPNRLFNLRFLYKGFYFISVDAWSHSKNLMVHHDKYCLASRKWDVGRKSADCP